MEKVALIGLGGMGQGIGQSLLRAGFQLVVYNRTSSKAGPLVARGARQVGTPAEAAAEADVIVAVVGGDEASKAIWLGTDGALEAARQESILVESSTLSVRWVSELARTASNRGLSFLDAPVNGSTDAAAAGQLKMMIGGDRAVLEQARPVLAAFASEITYMGPNGCGATMKLVNNLMGAVQTVALAEGLILAERAGLDINQVVSLISSGPPGSPIVKRCATRMAARDYTNPRFILRWMYKDATYASLAGEELGVVMPTVQAARETYRSATELGLDTVEFSAVIEVLRKIPQA